MSHRIKAALAKPDFSVQIEWQDGSSDTIDFKPIIARGGVMNRLADPEFFVNALQVEADGYALGWPTTPDRPDEVGGIDFSAASLWYRAHPDDLKRDEGDEAA
jgi:hypothetical protein